MSLIDAVRTNNLERVKMLVDQGADKDKGDSLGWIPLWWASWKGHIEVAQYLVEQGATLDKANNGGTTPLIAAVAGGHLEVCRYLLEQGADRDMADHRGWTPLHFAANNGRLKVAMLLMSYGADLNARDNSGRLPIEMEGYDRGDQAGYPRRAQTPHGRSTWQASHRARPTSQCNHIRFGTARRWGGRGGRAEQQATTSQ